MTHTQKTNIVEASVSLSVCLQCVRACVRACEHVCVHGHARAHLRDLYLFIFPAMACVGTKSPDFPKNKMKQNKIHQQMDQTETPSQTNKYSCLPVCLSGLQQRSGILNKQN